MQPKHIVCTLLLIASGVLSGFFWRHILDSPWYVLIFLSYSIFFGITSLVVHEKSLAWAGIAISLGGVAIFFPWSVWVLGGYLFAVYYMLGGYRNARKKYDFTLHINHYLILNRGLSMFFTGLIVFVVATHYGTIHKNKILPEKIIPRYAFDTIFHIFEKPLQAVLQMPQLSADITTDDFLMSLVARELSKQGISIDQISKPQLEALLKEARTHYLDSMGGGDAVWNGSETISNLLYQIMVRRLTEQLAPYISYIPPLVAISYFLALKSVSILLRWATLAILPVALYILFTIGIFKKETALVQKETIV